VLVDTDDVAVSIEHAIPLCLMLSELIALELPRLTGEHGRGELRINMRLSGGSIQLTVDVRTVATEPRYPSDRSGADELSLKLVKILVGQLRGEVEHDLDGHGSFRVVFPAA
jgi:two-component sensor histidine kinase